MTNVQGIIFPKLFPIARHQDNASLGNVFLYSNIVEYDPWESLAALTGSKFCSRPADTNLRVTPHLWGLIDHFIPKLQDPLSEFSNNCYLSRVKLVSWVGRHDALKWLHLLREYQIKMEYICSSVRNCPCLNGKKLFVLHLTSRTSQKEEKKYQV